MHFFLLLAFNSVIFSATTAMANEDFNQLMQKGWDEWDQENYKEAIKHCSSAIKIEPSNPEGYYCRGSAMSETGKNRSAYRDLTKAIELDPENLDYYYWRGVTIMSMYRKGSSKIHKVGCSDLKKAFSNKHDYTQEYVQDNRNFISLECPLLFNRR